MEHDETEILGFNLEVLVQKKTSIAVYLVYLLLSFSSFNSVNNTVNGNRPHLCLFDKSVLKETGFHGFCWGGWGSF